MQNLEKEVKARGVARRFHTGDSEERVRHSPWLLGKQSRLLAARQALADLTDNSG